MPRRRSTAVVSAELLGLVNAAKFVQEGLCRDVDGLVLAKLKAVVES
jgi:hypothetical protein